MGDEMTIDEFETEYRKDVDEFFAKFREGQQTQPSVFPATMTAGDWHEQVASHLEMLDS